MAELSRQTFASAKEACRGIFDVLDDQEYDEFYELLQDVGTSAFHKPMSECSEKEKRFVELLGLIEERREM